MQRAFILPHSVMFVKHFFQLFSKFSKRSARLRLTRTLLSYQIFKLLSRTFSRFSDSLVTLDVVLSDERTSVLFWCFVFLSSRCLIYKVHAALQRAFILPHSVMFVKHFFQLFSKFSKRSARLRLTRTLLSYQIFKLLSRTFSRFSDSLVTLDVVLSDANSFILAGSQEFVKHFFQSSYQIFKLLSRTFSRFSDSLVTLDVVLSDANSFILAGSQEFVKHFFQSSENFFSSSFCLRASCKALS